MSGEEGRCGSSSREKTRLRATGDWCFRKQADKTVDAVRPALTKGSVGIHSLNKSVFSTCCVPGCVLGTGYTAVNSF